MKETIIRFMAAGAAVLSMIVPQVALAHVTVKPAEAPVAKYTNFSVGVPVEKDVPTIGIRLVIPVGLTAVSPNVKPGWTIATQKTGNGMHDQVTEISWTGGTIPAGQRDEFLFTAKTPADATTVTWKAYQTYADGTIVSWDRDAESDEENIGPASKTNIINDLNAKTDNHNDDQDRKKDMSMSHGRENGNDDNEAALGLSLIAVALSVYAVYKSRKQS